MVEIPVNKESSRQFLFEIRAKGLPIPDQDAIKFAEFHSTNGAPEGFLSNVVRAARYINKDQADRGFHRMAEKGRQIVGTGDYYLATYDVGRSGLWVYDQLLDLGLPVTNRTRLSVTEDLIAGSPNHLENGRQPVVIIESAAKVLVPDDWALTGAQVNDIFFNTSKDTELSFLLLCGSKHALDLIKQTQADRQFNIFVAEDFVKPMNDFLYIKDKSYLERILEFSDSKDQWGMFEDSDQGGFLLWSHFNTPDNIPSIFTGDVIDLKTGQALPPLIRKITPPYETDKFAN